MGRRPAGRKPLMSPDTGLLEYRPLRRAIGLAPGKQSLLPALDLCDAFHAVRVCTAQAHRDSS